MFNKRSPLNENICGLCLNSIQFGGVLRCLVSVCSNGNLITHHLKMKLNWVHLFNTDWWNKCFMLSRELSTLSTPMWLRVTPLWKCLILIWKCKLFVSSLKIWAHSLAQEEESKFIDLLFMSDQRREHKMKRLEIYSSVQSMLPFTRWRLKQLERNECFAVFKNFFLIPNAINNIYCLWMLAVH